MSKMSNIINILKSLDVFSIIQKAVAIKEKELEYMTTYYGNIVGMEINGEQIDLNKGGNEMKHNGIVTKTIDPPEKKEYEAKCPGCKTWNKVYMTGADIKWWEHADPHSAGLCPNCDNWVKTIDCEFREVKPEPKPEPKSEIIKPQPAEKKPTGDIDFSDIRCGHMKMKNECMRKEQYKNLYRYGICDCNPNCISYKKNQEILKAEADKADAVRKRKIFEIECEQHKGEVYNNYTKTWSWL